ncbi:MAG TPA: DUF4157 domain-containing protein [Blastocatellia bacterium]|nr:DUF4157 domain-containing protein [Blastocatellia bacterium]
MFTSPSSFPLPDNLKSVLTPHFPGHDLSQVVIHLSIPWYVRKFAKITPAAYTSGNNIHFAPGKYDPDSVNGIARIAHEITHAQQYNQYGKFRFRVKYLAHFFKGKKEHLSDDEAYYAIKFEKEAYEKAADVKRQLQGQGVSQAKQCQA